MENGIDKTIKQPLNIEQAGNVLKREKAKDPKAEAKKHKRPISQADPAIIRRDMHRIIDHFIPEFGQWRQVKTLMKLRVNGASIHEIAFAFGVDSSIVMALEAKGREMIMKGIEREPAYRVLPKMNPKSRVIYPVS